MSEARARWLVRERSGGLCEARIPEVGCLDSAIHWHHRKNRSQGGGWAASNGLHLCLPCHHYVTDTNGHRARCEAAGWIVPGHADPTATPALIHTITLGYGLIMLDDDGMISYANMSTMDTREVHSD